MTMRTCRYCGETYELNKDNFGHNPQGGFRHKCRACVRAAVRTYNAEYSYRASERTEMRRSTSFSSSERERYRTILIRRDGRKCFNCKDPLDASAHIDHKVPIANGGTHAISNFVLACVPCNQEKHAKDIDEYREWRRQRGLAFCSDLADDRLVILWVAGSGE